jgi:ParB family chromosome partitioning protein
MAKTFQRRVSKRERKTIDLASNLDMRIFKINDDKLLRGAELQKVRLSEITVRKQVRTKFNDESISELAENIRENGLIQPLVLHREGDKFVLICGERRFRAMTTIEEMLEAPSFILENKTDEELMAIQFSENSAREALHYIDQADSIKAYQNTTGASERKIQSALGVSKSEVHRCLLISKLPRPIKESAKKFDIEKYVLLEWSKIEDKALKANVKSKIVNGELFKRAELRDLLEAHAPAKKKVMPKKVSAKAVYIKESELKDQMASMDLRSKKKLKELLEKSLN